MLTRERLINKLKALGYSFKKDAWRVTVFKKGTHRVEVRKRDILEEETVRQTLRQCGETNAQIDEFVRSCRS